MKLLNIKKGTGTMTVLKNLMERKGGILTIHDKKLYYRLFYKG